MTHGSLHISITCDGVADPPVDSAPLDVVISVGRTTSDQVQQLRRVLHELVATAPRSVIVDMSAADPDNAAIVFAVIVSAHRKAKSAGSTIQIVNPPETIRRSFAVAGLPETTIDNNARYTLVFDTANASEQSGVEQLAV